MPPSPWATVLGDAQKWQLKLEAINNRWITLLLLYCVQSTSTSVISIKVSLNLSLDSWTAPLSESLNERGEDDGGILEAQTEAHNNCLDTQELWPHEEYYH